MIDLQELGPELLIYGEIDDKEMRHINPSIAWHEGKLKIAIRKCNFKVERHGKWSFRGGWAYSQTDVVYGDLDPDTLQVSNLKTLKIDPKAPQMVRLAGLEDVRIYSRKDGMHAIGFQSDRITRSLHNKSTSMGEYLIKGNELKYIRTLEKPNPEAVEKNWSPTDQDDLFTYSPTQVWKSGKLIGEEYKGIIHGGTQLLKQKDGYISLVHDKILDRKVVPNRHRPTNIYDKYIYRTYLAKHDKQGFITELSTPFNFGTHENIEFASGMVEHGDDLLISLGIRDCKIAIARIPKKKLMDLLEPFTP